LLQAYDTDTGPAYTTFLTLTAGTAPTLDIGPFSSSGTINSNGNIITNIGATGSSFTTAGSLALVLDAADANGVLSINNASQSSPIFVAKDNGTMVFQIGDNGLITVDPATTGTVEDFTLATQWTSGTLINAGYGSSTTQSAALTGINLDFKTNFTGATGDNFTGLAIKTPTDFTATSATTYSAIDLSTVGAYTSNTGGTFTYNGIKLTTPNITQTAGTASANGIALTIGTATTGGTQTGIGITPAATTGSSTTTYGINVGDITTSNGTDTALYIGNKWDTGISFGTGITTAISISSGDLVTSNLGVNFTSSDTNPGCLSGEYKVYADTSETKLKKCENGTTSDLDRYGADMQRGTATLAETTLGNSSTFINTVSVTPTNATGDVYVEVNLWTKSLSNTDQTITLEIRAGSGSTCNGALLTSQAALLTSANSSNGPSVFATYLSVDPGASSQTYAVCALSGTASGASAGGIATALVIDSGSDLAEFYSTNDETLKAGDVVALDPALRTGVKKTTKVYENEAIGVVATRPGLVMGSVDKEGVKAVPVALAGRVPIRVTTENGSIFPGDLLTPSSTPGVAMKATKAGRIIGQAMESFDHLFGEGTVLAFVKNGLTFGVTPDLANIEKDTPKAGVLLLSYLMDDSLSATKLDSSSDITTDRLIAGLDVVTGRVTTNEVLLNSIKAATGTDINIEIGEDGLFRIKGQDGEDVAVIDKYGNATFKGKVTASSIQADQIEGLTILTNDLIAKRLASQEDIPKEATTSAAASNEYSSGKLNISGPVQIALDLEVVGMLEASGGLTVKGPANFENKTIFQSLAQFISQVIFKDSVIFEGRPTFNSDSGGLAVIKQGQQLVEVTFEKEYTQKPVINASITLPKIENSDENIAIQQQNDSERELLDADVKFLITRRTSKGFIIRLSKPAPKDITFSWSALAINDPRTAISKEAAASPIPISTPTPSTSSESGEVTSPSPPSEASQSAHLSTSLSGASSALTP
jgi:hypothetical protein